MLRLVERARQRYHRNSSARNDADKPETRYFATPEELFAAMRRIRESGQALLGVYHSHPRTAAYPSASDVEMAFYPEAFYFIIPSSRELNSGVQDRGRKNRGC